MYKASVVCTAKGIPKANAKSVRSKEITTVNPNY